MTAVDMPRAPRPRPSFVRHGVRVRDIEAYSVIWGGATFGEVRPVYLPSHIRRGRAQTTPHWQASDARGVDVGLPQQSRLEAGRLLVDRAFAGIAD